MYRRGPGWGWGWRRRPYWGGGWGWRPFWGFGFPGCGCIFFVLALLGLCAIFSMSFFRVPFWFYYR